MLKHEKHHKILTLICEKFWGLVKPGDHTVLTVE